MSEPRDIDLTERLDARKLVAQSFAGDPLDLPRPCPRCGGGHFLLARPPRRWWHWQAPAPRWLCAQCRHVQRLRP
jgi:hypothetical protein